MLTLLVQEPHFGYHCWRQRSTRCTWKMHLNFWESGGTFNTFNCSHFTGYSFFFSFCFYLFTVVFSFLRGKRHVFSILLPSQSFQQETHGWTVPLVTGWMISLEQLSRLLHCPRCTVKPRHPSPVMVRDEWSAQWIKAK